MKVVHIGFQYGLNNTGGAAIASTRLHLALLKAGVESHYVCVHKREDGPNVCVLPGSRIVRVLYFALTKFTRCIWKFTPYRRSICLNIVPMFGLERFLARINPDVVHVQWINADVCSFEQLASLPYRLVFNLHDLYMINAMAVHPGADTRFITGFAKSNSRILERWVFNRKRWLVDCCRTKGLSFVGPSVWTASLCRKSLIGKDVPVCVISNLIDPIIRFHREWRKPHEQFTILFCAFGGRRNSFKGWDDLEASIRVVANKITDKKSLQIVVCGEDSEDTDISGIKVHFLGIVTDAEVLCKVYHAADILAFPSKQETQGMTKIEALLCGLPVIAFDRTACAEGIVHGQTGWIATDGDIDSFAEGIQHFHELFCRNAIPHDAIADMAQGVMVEPKIISDLLTFYRG